MTPTIALDAPRWRALEAEHEARADALTAGWRARRLARETDAIEDFLFTYYPIKPGQLRRWHPGAGVRLLGAGPERADWRWYRGASGLDARAAARNSPVEVDAGSYLAARGSTVAFIARLLARTAASPAQFACFGLHEWAMVYRQGPEQVRHASTPLRLSAAETDAVVEGHRIACTHFDAYRFFTPEAAPLNLLRPTRETQELTEQAGCLHAGMDVYKWAHKLGPLVPGALLLDCFELARDIRVLDMRASPYSVEAYGYAAVAIETDAGKAEYVREQRGFRDRSNALRARLLDAIEAARADAAR